jgi:hypothetical protein
MNLITDAIESNILTYCLLNCKIWGFYGGDYEECRLLGYKNAVRTSLETHYISSTECKPVNAMNDLSVSRRVLWRIPSSVIYKTSSYLTGNTLRFRYRAQPVNAMYDLRFSRRWLWWMPSSWILLCEALVRADVSEERIVSLIWVTRVGDLGIVLTVTSNKHTLRASWCFVC